MSYEDRPEKDTPQWIQEDLRNYGGESPDGQPIWRLVLAQNCRVRCFGPTNIVDQAKIDTITDTTRPEDVVPDRIIDNGAEGIWIPRFKFSGWILQRWFPASTWGTRAVWEAERARDGRTRLLAAYPQRGDYMIMPCGPWRTLEEIPDLRAAIRSYNFQQQAKPMNWENETRAYAALEAHERQAAADAHAIELEATYRMGVTSVLTTVSSAAQQVRNRIAQSVGGVQLDAAAKWGS